MKMAVFWHTAPCLTDVSEKQIASIIRAKMYFCELHYFYLWALCMYCAEIYRVFIKVLPIYFFNFIYEMTSRPVVDILNTYITTPNLHVIDCSFPFVIWMFTHKLFKISNSPFVNILYSWLNVQWINTLIFNTLREPMTMYKLQRMRLKFPCTYSLIH
jgi:hypothetical protein